MAEAKPLASRPCPRSRGLVGPVRRCTRAAGRPGQAWPRGPASGGQAAAAVCSGGAGSQAGRTGRRGSPQAGAAGQSTASLCAQLRLDKQHGPGPRRWGPRPGVPTVPLSSRGPCSGGCSGLGCGDGWERGPAGQAEHMGLGVRAPEGVQWGPGTWRGLSALLLVLAACPFSPCVSPWTFPGSPRGIWAPLGVVGSVGPPASQGASWDCWPADPTPGSPWVGAVKGVQLDLPGRAAALAVHKARSWSSLRAGSPRPAPSLALPDPTPTPGLSPPLSPKPAVLLSHPGPASQAPLRDLGGGLSWARRWPARTGPLDCLQVHVVCPSVPRRGGACPRGVPFILAPAESQMGWLPLTVTCRCSVHSESC